MKVRDYLNLKAKFGTDQEKELAQIANALLACIETEAKRQRKIFSHAESETLSSAIRLADGELAFTLHNS